MTSKFCLVFLVLAVAWTGTITAQDVQVRSDHPDEYVVVKGDTLWDISGRFLTNPWEWPAIWQANPQIENPHLIYPGDRISLIYVDGQPRLVVNAENRLSPEIRETSLTPIDTIALEDIEEFLRYPRMISWEEFEGLPHVVANNEQRLNAVTGDHAYVRGFNGFEGQEVIVARLNYVYQEAENRDGDKELRQVARGDWGSAVPDQHRPFGWTQTTWQKMAKRPIGVLGVELWEVAQARVLKTGDVSIIEVEGGRREVQPGDFILTRDNHVYDSHFFPNAMDAMPDDLRVLNISEAVYGVGHYGIVAINAGTDDGMEPGHTFSAFRPGNTIKDTYEYPLHTFKRVAAGSDRDVTLPDEYIGQVMVFRTFDQISYGIVLEGKRMVRGQDVLRHPSERI